MKKIWFKYSAIALIIGFYLIVSVQGILPYCNILPLHGDVVQTADSSFSWKRWGNENYQKQKEKYLNENFGFRQLFVRLHNQIYFSIFNKAFANGVIVGKNNYLYEENYLEAVTGKDLLPDELIEAKVDSFIKTRDQLRKNGTELLLILAPGKGSFYPEFIPNSYGKPVAISNYSKYRDQFLKTDLAMIDCNSWFKAMKDSSTYPLYPKTGIHWSQYGVSFVVDSLIRFIEKNYNVTLPERKVENLKLSKKDNIVDRDIEEGMNLLFPISRPMMAYPKYIYRDDQPKTFSVLTVADSFYWQIFGDGTSEHLFKNPAFYYYFQRAYFINEAEKNISDINVVDEIKKYNLVLFIVTEANLPKFDFDFSKTYLSKNSVTTAEFEIKVQEKIHAIKETPEWFNQIKAKAVKNNKTLDQMLREDATWVVEQESKK